MDIPLVLQALARRLRSDGSEPLLTHYDEWLGSRTELSVATVANWVAKTANLIDELGADGEMIGLQVAQARPGHWMTLIWPLAAWQRGCPLSPIGEGADLCVIGPDDLARLDRFSRPGRTLIACSLHPLGLRLTGLPDGVLDYSSEALAQPDRAGVVATSSDQEAWREHTLRVSHAEVARQPSSADRVLVRPSEPFTTLAQAVIGPLLGGGSAVIVEGPADEARLAAIRAAERCVP